MGEKKFKKITQSKYKLSDDEQKACHGIIHTASVAAGTVGAGLAQIPVADNTIITPIQVGMIVSLGKVFGQTITKSVAKSLLGGFIANFVGRGVAQLVYGWIPGVGNVSNAVTAAAITESLGWLSVDHFYKEKYFEDQEKMKNSADTTCEEDEIIISEEILYDVEQLKVSANEFINGEKDRRNNKEEFKDLLKQFDDLLVMSPDNNELREVYDKFIRIK